MAPPSKFWIAPGNRQANGRRDIELHLRAQNSKWKGCQWKGCQAAIPHGWLMKGKSACLLPLLHRLVEERAGERRLSSRWAVHGQEVPSQPAALHEPAVGWEQMAILMECGSLLPLSPPQKKIRSHPGYLSGRF